MLIQIFAASFLAFVYSANASPLLATYDDDCSSQNVEARTVYQFPNGAWVENIAVRANGNVLVTLLDRPELYELDPRNPACATLVHSFPGYLSLLGITESAPDVFSVVAGNFSLQTGGQNNSYGIWNADFSRGKDGVKINKITDIPEAVLLNGMTTLDPEAGTVLVSDSTLGVVFRVDTQSGDYAVVLDDATFKPPTDSAFPVGINGIRVFHGYLYYTNTFKPIYGRVPIDGVSGEAAGPYETISTGIMADDFALHGKGTAYLAAGFSNRMVRVGPNGRSNVIAGTLNSTLVAGATSAAFGRTWMDSDILYVSTSGAQAAPVNGTFTEGGKIVALNVY